MVALEDDRLVALGDDLPVPNGFWHLAGFPLPGVKPAPVDIPHRELSPEALQGLLEEIASRDGTESTPVAQKVERLKKLLDQGKIRLVYDTDSETCGVLEVP